MIRKQLKVGQLFTYHRHVYQVTKKIERCPRTKRRNFCALSLPYNCYPKLIK